MRKRQSLSGRMAATGCVLLFLAILVLGVMRLPQVYGGYSDRRTLNHPEYTENDVKVYVYDYASMEEKLQDIVYYQKRSIELQEVYIPAAGDTEVLDGKLTGYLQQELDRLYQLGILSGAIDLSAYHLIYRSLCNVYPGNGDRLKGRISYWLLNYESTEGLLTAKMDTEYHKLYNISMDGTTDAGRECSAQGEYLVSEMLKAGKSGRETAVDLMDKLSQGYAEYFGITVSEETKESGTETESLYDAKKPEKSAADAGNTIYEGVAQEHQADQYTDYTFEKSGYKGSAAGTGTYEKNATETDVYTEKTAEETGRRMEDIVWLIGNGEWEWGFSVENSRVVKEDGSRLRFRANYQYDSTFFSTGILWES